MYLDKTASIQRLTELQSDSDKEEYSAVSGLEAIKVNVQPANSETIALSNGIVGKTYIVFTPVSGVKDGDRVTVSGTFIDGFTVNKQLQVMNVANWNFGPLPHYEITCGDIEQ